MEFRSQTYTISMGMIKEQATNAPNLQLMIPKQFPKLKVQ